MNDAVLNSPAAGDALLVIDVQRDFLPGGALAVPAGDAVIEPLNRYLDLFAAQRLPVFASRDWHPADHCSFAGRDGPWPPHCQIDTSGAEFAPQLRLPEGTHVVSKASHPDHDAYSDFAEPGFEQTLRGRQIRRLFVGGLATEYCVLATVRDALVHGFDVVLLTDAIRPIDVTPGDGRRAIDEMTRLGAVPVTWNDIAAQTRPAPE